MQLSQLTSITIQRKIKEQLENLKNESTDEDGNKYESWDTFFEDLVQFVSSKLDENNS